MITAHKLILKVAIIDMNNGAANEGIRSIKAILEQYGKDHETEMLVETFDLRDKLQIPGLEHDIYISSGGPGSPFEGENTIWERSFFDLLAEIKKHNRNHPAKKYTFLICYSFQLACRKYAIGTVTGRSSTSFGIFPVSLTAKGEMDTLYKGLPNPFDAFDNRDWQVLDADDEIAALQDVEVLALEKERLHTGFERCLMSIRFSGEMVGTQFHPEANLKGMKGLRLENPGRIVLTQAVVLPNFLTEAIRGIRTQQNDR